MPVSSQLYAVANSVLPQVHSSSLIEDDEEYIVTLTRDERARLETLTSKGKHSAQQILNALILFGFDEGGFQRKRLKNEKLSCVVNLGIRKIDRVKE